ncbi:uncharacterized protein trk [Periplaneta americana]|uniref:uncharacterized protein trk n=1 Tax=Periplaneta americana TaxID=6978 RepID=UPI0037E7BDC3
MYCDRGRKTRTKVTYLVLLLLSSWRSNTAEARFPREWGPQVFVKDLIGDEDCLEGSCFPPDRQPEENQRGRLNFMLRHQEFLSDDDEMEKRDPPASYSADSGLLSAAGGAVLFRDSNPTPCSCYSDNLPPSYRDLGLGVYPRYLSDVTCNYSSCGSSLYRCQPLNHTIFVLKSKNAVEQMDTSDSDRLPKPLRSKWRFEGINITVACVCQRYHSNG